MFFLGPHTLRVDSPDAKDWRRGRHTHGVSRPGWSAGVLDVLCKTVHIIIDAVEQVARAPTCGVKKIFCGVRRDERKPGSAELSDIFSPNRVQSPDAQTKHCNGDKVSDHSTR